MAAAVETMFYTREKPWHGLGIRVDNAPDSEEALDLAGLNWQVVQEPIYSTSGIEDEDEEDEEEISSLESVLSEETGL